MPQETASALAHSVYTIQQYTMSQRFMQSHICRMHECLAVTCHWHLWQNDRGLLPGIVVTLGWNRYQNMSQHRKLIPEKTILLPLLLGLKPRTFWPPVWCSITWAIPTPHSLADIHTYFVYPMLRLKPLANTFPYSAPKQGNSLPSDSHHIQSSLACVRVCVCACVCVGGGARKSV